MYNTTPITGVYASALSALGIEPAAGTQAPIAALDKLNIVYLGRSLGGKPRDDEREQDGDQMVLGLRAAAAFRLGHGMHLL